MSDEGRLIASRYRILDRIGAGRNSGRETGEVSSERPQRVTTSLRARRSPGRSRETMVLAASVAAVTGGATDDRTEIQLAGCSGDAGQQCHLSGTALPADQSQRCVDTLPHQRAAA